MCGLLLVCLGECVPIFRIGVDVVIATDEGFFLVDSDDFDHFRPLVSDVALLISLDDGGLDVVEVVDPIGHLHVVVELYLPCSE